MVYLSVKITQLPLTKVEFETLKSHQFCDDRACEKYGLVAQGNIKTHSFASGQGFIGDNNTPLFTGRRKLLHRYLKTRCGAKPSTPSMWKAETVSSVKMMQG